MDGKAGISVRVLLDSISPAGKRIVTSIWRYPRYIHDEVLTHRMMSRNAASSRAIPISKMLAQVVDDPSLPVWWGRNQKGMQAKEELSVGERPLVWDQWMGARDDMAARAKELEKLDLHKQITNRLLMPWQWMVTLITATEFDNLFHLRCHKDAQPEFQCVAFKGLEAFNVSKPTLIKEGEWHLPYIKDEERKLPVFIQQKCSAARCARISYSNSDGTSPSIEADVGLFEKLVAAPHASPFEHQATPDLVGTGNFKGWKQFRFTIPHENHHTYVPLKKWKVLDDGQVVEAPSE